jgi:hypothetical protein
MIVTMDASKSVADLIKEFGRMQQKQAPFAMRLALRRTAEEARDAVRNRVYQRGFKIRSASFARMLSRAIVIEQPRASTGASSRYVQRIVVNSNVGKGRSLMPWLEAGGTRSSRRNIGPFANAVAVPLRSGPMGVVPRNLYPSATGIGGTTFTIPQRPAKGVHRGARGQIIGSVGWSGRVKGKRRTFMIESAGGGMIFQRVGKADNALRALFTVRMQVQVPGRFFFFKTAERVISERLVTNFRGALQAALWSNEIGRPRGIGLSYRGGYAHPSRSW